MQGFGSGMGFFNPASIAKELKDKVP